MSLRFHEISEANHRILNPLSEEKLMLLGEICDLESDMSLLDLACGKGEMLCQWSKRHGIQGVGVDISNVFITAARKRAAELKVANKIKFIEQDATTYPQPSHSFDIVSCIDAAWIGGGVVGILELMKPTLKFKDSLLLIGEPYWIEPPPREALVAIETAGEDYTTLDGTLERFDEAGVELVEMVLADQDSWDRYAAAQWKTLNDWLRENPDDADAPAVRQWLNDSRHAYLKYGRRYFGWGAFVLRPCD